MELFLLEPDQYIGGQMLSADIAQRIIYNY